MSSWHGEGADESSCVLDGISVKPGGMLQAAGLLLKALIA